MSERPATKRQRRLLESWGYDLEELTVSEASEIISEEIEDRRNEPASERQIRYLEGLGVDFHPRITKGDASSLIEEETT